MKENAPDVLLSFINGSESFNSFTFQGLYSMSRENFIRMFRHFIDTGENHLDEFSEMTWMGYSQNESLGFEYFPSEKREKINGWIDGASFWLFSSFVTTERMGEIKRSLVLSEAHDINQSTYQARRKVASRHTSKKEVREVVFEKHGEVCVKCGGTDNIQIDHIVPVAKGGENSIDNYQPLCKSCNASKGASVE